MTSNNRNGVPLLLRSCRGTWLDYISLGSSAGTPCFRLTTPCNEYRPLASTISQTWWYSSLGLLAWLIHKRTMESPYSRIHIIAQQIPDRILKGTLFYSMIAELISQIRDEATEKEFLCITPNNKTFWTSVDPIPIMKAPVLWNSLYYGILAETLC